MKTLNGKILLAAAMIAMFAVAAIQVPLAHSSETSDKNQLTEFLSNVVGLDMAEYNLTWHGYGSEHPSELSGTVEQGYLSCKLESNTSNLDTLTIFYNGKMTFSKIYLLGGGVIYSHPPAADILSQAKNILQRYQIHVTQECPTNGSYLVPMQNILNNLTELTPTDTTIGNINFQVSQNADTTFIQWIYSRDGVSMNRKRVDLEFLNSTFASFSDTWELYKVDGLSVISQEEAIQIAREAAEKCELHSGSENGTRTATPPDLTDAPYDVTFSMVPGLSVTTSLPSNKTRDPLTLYPYWQFHFYFSQKIAGNSGIQVGVWGDTQEIVYCSGFGYLGGSGMANTQTSPTPEATTSASPAVATPRATLPPADQTKEEQTSPNTLDSTTLAVASVAVAAIIIVIAAVAWRRQKPRLPTLLASRAHQQKLKYPNKKSV